MLERVVFVRALDAFVCLLLQLGGLVITSIALVKMRDLAAVAWCDYGELLSHFGPSVSAWTIEHMGVVVLALLAWGHVAPLVAIPALRARWSPVAIQAALTLSQVLVAITLWLALISDFPRSH